MTQFDARNVSMVMDFYELTMAEGYFKSADQPRVAFDVFYRKVPSGGGFAIFAGLEQIIEYVENFRFEDSDVEYLRSLNLFSEVFLDYLRKFRFRGDIYAFAEGTIIYPQEPFMTVVASPIDAQLIETAILSQINHQSLIATKARRIVKAADGRSVFDFGARRAHNFDAAVYGARAVYIGGADGTATILAAKAFGIPTTGTMAHSWVMYFGDEFEAFKPYDVLHSGVPNAIKTAKEVLEPMGKRLKAVRLDSGDLAYLSKKTRAMLDAAGLQDCKIIVSNSLDEYTIASILTQGGRIDGFGVGERLITSKSDPVFGGVYKLVAVENKGIFSPRIKVSEAVEKMTNPGLKKVWRIYRCGQAVADLITNADETPDLSKPYRYIDPDRPWKELYFEGCTARQLQNLVVKDGKRAAEPINLAQIREYVKEQLENEIWQEEQRFENPHKHYVDMSVDYYEMKMELLRSTKK